MANIATINGIAEDNISHHNGGTAALYTSKNGDTWVHNVAPTNPADNMVDFGENSSQTVTFAGASDSDGSVTHYKVDNISNGILTVSTAEVSAGSAHTFNSGAVSANTTVSFRVRAKDNTGAYSSGITMNTVIENQFYAGTTYGYALGGYAGGTQDFIQIYAFSSSGNSTDIANLYRGCTFGSGAQSTTYGYVAVGGYGASAVIDKHQFGTTNNSTLVGTLTNNHAGGGGASSPTHGYVAGGAYLPIDRWSFASGGNATQSGVLQVNHQFGGHASDWGNSYGYRNGGATSAISRWAFSSSANSSYVSGTMPYSSDQDGSASSTTHGYTLAGYSYSTAISKFSFGSTATTSVCGTLSAGGYHTSGTTSTTHAYCAGGLGRTSTIDRMSFSSEGTASAVGTLAQANARQAGFHV